jgi:hypothetical protein
LEQGPAGAISQFETFHNINLAATASDLAGAHQTANKRDMPYQSLIKAWLAEKVDAQ